MASLSHHPIRRPTDFPARTQREEFQLRSAMGAVVMAFDDIDRAREMLELRQAMGNRLRLFRSTTVVEEIAEIEEDISNGQSARN